MSVDIDNETVRAIEREFLCSDQEGGGAEEKARALGAMCANRVDRKLAEDVLCRMLRRYHAAQRSLKGQRQATEALKTRLHEQEKLLGEALKDPWLLATLIDDEVVKTDKGPKIRVGNGSRASLVSIAPTVDPAKLRMGVECFLSAHGNCILGVGRDVQRYGLSVGMVKQALENGRFLLERRGESIPVRLSHVLSDRGLKDGEQVCFDEAGVVHEVLPEDTAARFLVEDAPAETFDDVGGQDAAVAALKRAVDLGVAHGETARRFHLQPPMGILMKGPPGCGKSLLARAFCNYLSTNDDMDAGFSQVSVSSLLSMWYAESEKNIRNYFASFAKEAMRRDVLVSWWDEIDSMGSTRSHHFARAGDRGPLQALLQGLSELHADPHLQGRVFVLLATNKPESLDPALLRQGRIDLQVDVGRPSTQSAARSVLACHMPAGVPYAHADLDHARSRESILDGMVAQLLAPNGALHEVGEAVYADGGRETVTGAAIVSGSLLAEAARRAREHACLRVAEGRTPAGVTLEDGLGGLEEALRETVSCLRPHNLRDHLALGREGLEVVGFEARFQESAACARQYALVEPMEEV